MDNPVGRECQPCKEWSGHGWPFVSVIVPFFGTDTGLLDRCVSALLAQEYPRDRLELLIVDNNTRPALGNRYWSSMGFLSVIHEPQPGSYSARNSGISNARGRCLHSLTVTAFRLGTGFDPVSCIYVQRPTVVLSRVGLS